MPARPVSSKSVVRLIVTNWIAGAAVGVLCAALVLWLDIAGLRHLMFRDGTMAAGLALLFGGFAITFGSVVCGTAIMTMAAREDRNDRGGTLAPAEPALVPVAARPRGPRRQG